MCPGTQEVHVGQSPVLTVGQFSKLIVQFVTRNFTSILWDIPMLTIETHPSQFMLIGYQSSNIRTSKKQTNNTTFNQLVYVKEVLCLTFTSLGNNIFGSYPTQMLSFSSSFFTETRKRPEVVDISSKPHGWRSSWLEWVGLVCALCSIPHL